MSIDVMKQALEALEEINKLSIGENAICLPAEIDGAITALRAAIEQAPWVKTYTGGQPHYTVPLNRPPVAWRKHYENSGYTYYDARWKNIPPDAEPLYL